MLPTPATIRESIRRFLTGAVRPRSRRCSQAPLNAGPSGSGPRWASSRCRVGSAPAHNQQPKRRGVVVAHAPAVVEDEVDVVMGLRCSLRIEEPQASRHPQVDEQGSVSDPRSGGISRGAGPRALPGRRACAPAPRAPASAGAGRARSLRRWCDRRRRAPDPGASIPLRAVRAWPPNCLRCAAVRRTVAREDGARHHAPDRGVPTPPRAIQAWPPGGP